MAGNNEDASNVSINLIRWIVKKSARLMFAAVMNGSGRNKPRILTYHYFDPAPRRSPFTVGTADFEQQIRFIAESGTGLSIEELGRSNSISGLSGGKIVVTIDDGHRSVFEYAVPILKRYNIGAIIFVVPTWIGSEGFLSESELLEIAKDGFLIGSHSMNHRLLAPLPYSCQYDEAKQSKIILENMIGSTINLFAYPYGTRHAFSASTRDALASAGYDLAFTSQHGGVMTDTDRLSLPRVKIESGDPFWVFRRACSGSLDRWRYVDELLAFLQRPPKQGVKSS
jgi:peptidoglycan/xylan/chitin deacetylase (PgdA/CDA1 family)